MRTVLKFFSYLIGCAFLGKEFVRFYGTKSRNFRILSLSFSGALISGCCDVSARSLSVSLILLWIALGFYYL
jgi:hypothetical protein